MFEYINKWIIGTSLPIVLIFAGGFFLIFLKFKPFRSPTGLLSAMISPCEEGNGGVSPFRSVTMALAGTLGVGNIVGVASAIAMGGFGAVFWMWISALFAMILKYAEIVLAIFHRPKGEQAHGGAMWYIKNGIKNKKLGGALASIFAALCTLDALSMGCIVQVNALSGAVNGALGTPKILIGMIVALMTALVITKGARGISKITEWLVPLMSLGYIVISVAVMIICRDRLPYALSIIFKDAFSVKSGAGGLMGFLISDGLRYGTMRGLLSNEAGCGTAPFAHAVSNQKEPAKQGVWGIFEVFVDTILLCTMTAVVVIISYDEVCMLAPDGMLMTMKAYSSVLGAWSEYFLAVAVFLFAYATVICWSHYGGECVAWLTKNKKTARFIFNAAFCVCAFIGAVIAPEEIWTLADFSIGSMTLINIFVVLLMSGEVKRLTDEVF